MRWLGLGSSQRSRRLVGAIVEAGCGASRWLMSRGCIRLRRCPMPRYELTDLSEPAGSESSFALDINDSGNVAGGATFSGDPSTRAVAWVNGASVVLDASSAST